MNSQKEISESAIPEQSFTYTVIAGLGMNKQIVLGKVCEVMHGTQPYPVVSARSPSFDSSKPTVLLSAGMHGDEPAGIHAVIRFVTQEMHRYTDRFNFLALPCLNPSGFAAGMHNTESGLNFNDVFGKQSEDAVVRAVEEMLKPIAPTVTLALDLHEDNSHVPSEEELPDGHHSEGCYVYETISSGETHRIAQRVFEVLELSDICQSSTIHKERNNKGVIDHVVNGSKVLGSLDWFLKKNGAQHVLTVETPAAWPIEKRIQTHLAIIRRSLELI